MKRIFSLISVPNKFLFFFIFLYLYTSQLNSQTRDVFDAIENKDYSTAIKIWESRSQQGDASAQFNLALLYHFGLGVDKNINIAIYWYERSAANGDSKAQNNLGHLFYEGIEIKKDIPRAVHLFKLAARQGISSAQLNLGRSYTKGIGIKPDLLNGFIWLSMAEKSNLGSESEKVKIEISELSELLTGKQLSLAKIMVTKCWDTSFKVCEMGDNEQ